MKNWGVASGRSYNSHHRTALTELGRFKHRSHGSACTDRMSFLTKGLFFRRMEYKGTRLLLGFFFFFFKLVGSFFARRRKEKEKKCAARRRRMAVTEKRLQCIISNPSRLGQNHHGTLRIVSPSAYLLAQFAVSCLHSVFLWGEKKSALVSCCYAL